MNFNETWAVIRWSFWKPGYKSVTLLFCLKPHVYRKVRYRLQTTVPWDKCFACNSENVFFFVERANQKGILFSGWWQLSHPFALEPVFPATRAENLRGMKVGSLYVCIGEHCEARLFTFTANQILHSMGADQHLHFFLQAWVCTYLSSTPQSLAELHLIPHVWSCRVPLPWHWLHGCPTKPRPRHCGQVTCTWHGVECYWVCKFRSLALVRDMETTQTVCYYKRKHKEYIMHIENGRQWIRRYNFVEV